MNTFKLIFKVFVGATVSYTTFKLLAEKADELLDDGGMLGAFTVGAGQMGLAIAAGLIAAEAITKEF